MYLMLRNQNLVNNLLELSKSSSKVMNHFRCLSNLNSNQFNSINICQKFNQNNKICLQKVLNSNQRQSLRTFQTSNCHLKDKEIEIGSSFDLMDGLIYKIRRKLGYTTVQRSILQESSVYIYEACTDGIPIEKFFNYLKLPDSYLSWFLVTQIHVWMCLTRAMSEGKEGRVLRNEITGRMWDDCQNRIKLLTYMPMKVQKQGMDDLLQQFQAAIIAYDEGFLTDDKVLAAALWRTLFMYEEVDPQSIETMVSYIRTQLDHLQTIGTETFVLNGRIVWKDFPPLYP